ncbi:MAG TPA: tetratricopeptide repeat protein, partial [Candidatus Acetothermia bacterium]|nr:tetratricopeptide repeat protein [Candidatus Acetothermia bacterium]
MAGHPSGEGEALTPPLPDPGRLTEGERREICDRALAQAEELRRAGRHQEGIALLVDVLRYGVNKAQVYFRLGNLYFDSGDLSRAEYAYKRAIEEDPKHASAHHNLGV